MSTKIFKQESIQITCEDNMDLMARYEDNHFDLAVVDPPYGIGVNKMTLGNGKKKIYRGDNDWDAKIPPKEYWDELMRVSKNQIVWGGNYMTEYLKPMSSWIFWDKGTGANDFADGELAWTSFGGALRMFKKSWVGANGKDAGERIHPTQKPMSLYMWCIKKYAKSGHRILDTHLGSGSIAIAVDSINKIEKMDLSLVACELDEEYFEKAIQRIKAKTQWQSLF